MPRFKRPRVVNNNRRPKVCICEAPPVCPMAPPGAAIAEDGNANITCQDMPAEFDGTTPTVTITVNGVSRTPSAITEQAVGSFDFLIDVPPTSTDPLIVLARYPNGCTGNAVGQTTA